MIIKFCVVYGVLGNTVFSKHYSFDIYEEYTIQQLKCIIHEYFEYDVDTLVLSILESGVELNNDKTIRDYKNEIENNIILIYGTLNCNEESNKTYIPSGSTVNYNTTVRDQLEKNKEIIRIFQTLHTKTEDEITEILYEYPYLFMGLLTSYTDLLNQFCKDIPNYTLSMSVEDITHINSVSHIFKEIGEEINLPDESHDLEMFCLTRNDYNIIMNIKDYLEDLEDKDIEIIVDVYMLTHKNELLTVEFLR